MSDQANLASCGCCADESLETSHQNRPGQDTITYRIGTHATFLQRMVRHLARTEIPSGPLAGQRPLARLTTRASEDLTVALVDAWAMVADVLSFYQERIANEGFLRTAGEHRSVLELARAIGYTLNPGVAATTYLSFTLSDAPSAAPTALIAAGTQVQSIPATKDEVPQTFETEADFTAQTAWNLLKPRTTVSHPITLGTTELYLAGVSTQLQPGDAILIVGAERRADSGNEQWDVRFLQTVSPDPAAGYTRVTWADGLGRQIGNRVIMRPAATEIEVYAFRQRAALFGASAPDWRAMPLAVKQGFKSGVTEIPATWGSEWPNFSLPVDPEQPVIDLDALYPKILEKSWLALGRPTYVELYRAKAVTTGSRTDFTLTAKTTRIALDTVENLHLFDRRSTLVYAQAEQLPLADKPLTTPVAGSTIELDGQVAGLTVGQPIIVSGKLAASDCDMVSEVAHIASTVESDGTTTLVLQQNLARHYVRASVTIQANVVAASHGETVTEVLGSGDGARAHQSFTLQKSPLTYLSAVTASGAASTLAVRVNQVRWNQRPSLYGLQPDDRSYLIQIDDQARASVIFGDGRSGARLPTGQENVTATYRTGIGSQGEVGAGSLTLLKTRPFGVRAVTNPVAADGAAEPERLADARVNAPRTVLTMDRIVSLLDYENFARAFAGIGKAQAVSLWNGEQQLAHITVADDSGDNLLPGSTLFTNLRSAIDGARDPSAPYQIASFLPLFFRLEATIQYDARYLAADLQAGVEGALLETFSFAHRTFGQPVTAAEVMDVIHDITGVVAVDLDALYLTPSTSSADATAAGFGPSLLPGRLGDLLTVRPGGRLSRLGAASRLQLRRPGLTSVLPARVARRQEDAIRLAELLLIDHAGVTLTMKPL